MLRIAVVKPVLVAMLAHDVSGAVDLNALSVVAVVPLRPKK
jgi:hypothetical protein